MREYITELANDIAKSCPDLVENGCGNDNCVACLAFKLTGLGYQKQEWISVEDRLPEPNEDCLVAANVGERMVVDLGERVWSFDYRTMEHSYAWSIMNDLDEGERCEITHWMPLPKPPKMRKEDEGK